MAREQVPEGDLLVDSMRDFKVLRSGTLSLTQPYKIGL